MGFRRIRHFGFLANGHRTSKLAAIREALSAPASSPIMTPTGYRERYALLTGRSLDICPCCGGHMVEIAMLVRSPTRTTRTWCDSS